MAMSTEEKAKIESAVRALWPDAPEKLTKKAVLDRIKALHPLTKAQSSMRYEELVPHLEEASQWQTEREHRKALDAIHPRGSIRGNAGGHEGWQHEFFVEVGWSLANTFRCITRFIQDVMYVKGLHARYEALKAAKGQTLEDGSTVTQEDIDDTLDELLMLLKMLREPHISTPSTAHFQRWAASGKVDHDAWARTREK